MNERRKPYPFDRLEPKWQARWDAGQTFHTPNPGEPGFDATRPKYYVLDMFPYPSGAGLHVGHPEGYTATDIVARARRLQGCNVLHPMGWDAFGLPAEQYAIKTGQHPAVTTARNVAHFKKQLQRIGFSYDWQREVNTTDPGYFKWTQWIFLQLYGAWFNPETQRAEPIASYAGSDPDSVRLAYVAEAPVNWCPELGTVLANEEVIEGKSEVGGHPVERRPMRQWMLRITAFAQRLIDELDGLDWPEGIKLLQKNWIGRSEGAEVWFGIDPGSAGAPPAVSGVSPETSSAVAFGEAPNAAGGVPALPVFTTRPDTLFGATYMVLAPEHALVEQITTEEQWAAVRDYRERTARKSDLERTELAKEKTGVFTGAFAVNPVTGARLPIWIADYVLTGYGTGAIMAVPAHDERDFEFATKFGLEIKQVVGLGSAGPSPAVSGAPPETSADDSAAGARTTAPEAGALPFIHAGIAINSPLIDGLATAEAKTAITAWLDERALGKKTINYKLRDWLFSRQRYWGEPFPIVWENGRHRALDESELPLTPPELDDFKPTGTGEPPLARATDWIRYSETAMRETNTMPQWAGSCWYYLRYCDPRNDARFVGMGAEQYWMGAAGSQAHISEEKAQYSHPLAQSAKPPGQSADSLGRPAEPPARSAEPPSQPADSPAQPAEPPARLAEPLARPAEPPGRSAEPLAQVAEAKTRPGGVDLYVGGTEHAVLHLLYARFWHKVLYDLGHLSTPEPFQRLVNQGIILGEDGQKMSKSRGNVVNPDDVIAEYGADAFRCYEMFMGPLEQMKPWSMTGVEGVSRFLARVWRLIMVENQAGEWVLSPAVQEVEPTKAQLKVLHATIKKVTADIEMLSFNTAISAMMICVNALIGEPVKPLSALRTLLVLLNPFAPHLRAALARVG